MASDRSMIPSEIPLDRVELTYIDGPARIDKANCPAAVCVGGAYTRQTAGMIGNAPIELVTLVDWPQGLAKTTVRQIEAVAAAKDGTRTVEIALCSAFVWTLFNRNFRNDVVRELASIVATVREVSREINVRATLNTWEYVEQTNAMREICLMARESGMDGVVAAAGVPTLDLAYENAVKGLVEHAEGLSVKVMLPCETDGVANRWLELGVDRIGLALHWR